MERPFPAYEGDESYVFVCYSHEDAGIVYPELVWLRENGVNVWYDEGITPGEEFPERLGRAILGAGHLLFYVSPRSVASKFCRNEVFFALDRDTPVIAVHIEKTNLPPGLALTTGTAQAIMRHELARNAYRRKLLAGLDARSRANRPGDTAPVPAPSPDLAKRLRPLRWPVAGLALLALLIFAGVQVSHFMDYQERVRWARAEAIPEIQAMVNDRWRDFIEPYDLALKVEEIIPDDPGLQAIFETISVDVDVGSQPSGATVSYKKYNAPDDEWTILGVTPIENRRMPIGIFRWKFELDGHETVLAAASTWDIRLSGGDLIQANNVFRKLDKTGELPAGMVRVQGAQTPLGEIGDFFIDRFEVTNARFQQFVDAGGYEDPQYWEHEFIDQAEVIPWEEGVARFVDSTGRPGPADWLGGSYPDRLGDHPVSGVSWYEAAAYARFAGKELPTAAHWGLARGEYSPLIEYPQLGGFATFAPFSNVGGNGTVAVGSLPGVTAYGAFDLAGNVREWCSNVASVGHAVRGGSWKDNPYDFASVVHAPSMMRTPGYGFRTAMYPDPEKIPGQAFADTVTYVIDNADDFEPVSKEVFNAYLNRYAYDLGGLDAQVITRDESHPDWTLERVSIATPYSDDRIIVNLFLPRNSAPPYQTVIYVPGSAALFQQSSEDISNYYEIPLFLSFLMKSGRAVALPTYQGTFERWDARYPPLHVGARTHAFSDFMSQVVKDFRRSVDYLETRDDIDTGKLAYYGMSWGGWLGSVIAAVEDRVAVIILLAGGVIDIGLPEVNPMNYVPHIEKPLLLMNGEYDTLINFEHSARAMHDRVATRPDDLVLKVYPTDHIPPKNEYVREILDWLDRYFGPVTRAADS